MKIGTQLPVAILTLAAPLAAYADDGAPHILLYSFGGGFFGGLIGALLACWLCKRMRPTHDETVARPPRDETQIRKP